MIVACEPASRPAPTSASSLHTPSTVRCAFGRVEIAEPAAVDRDVFTDRERWRVAGRAAQHAAGALAGKHAVASLLGIERTDANLRGIEIVPQPSQNCLGSAACTLGHPPSVVLDPRLQRQADGLGLTTAQLSISHAAGIAVAVAIATVRYGVTP
jgi:phosphopantetheinyl transferase (holo-ACP synthase)